MPCFVFSPLVGDFYPHKKTLKIIFKYLLKMYASQNHMKITGKRSVLFQTILLLKSTKF